MSIRSFFPKKFGFVFSALLLTDNNQIGIKNQLMDSLKGLSNLTKLVFALNQWLILLSFLLVFYVDFQGRTALILPHIEYFSQQTRAAHPLCWSKYAFCHFSKLLPHLKRNRWKMSKKQTKNATTKCWLQQLWKLRNNIDQYI